MLTRLYFELEHYDRWHRADWENRLAGWLGAAPVGLVERAARPDDADLIIEPSSIHAFINGRVFTVDPRSHYRRRPDATFAWDAGDHPTGRLPGLFCSLRDRLADSRRHRGFCYPLRVNPLVRECALGDARYLFGFSGNVTAPLRARLFGELRKAASEGRALLRRTPSVFDRIYSPETDVEKTRFADDLRLCRFVLCPRGNGLSSIRLFESMEAARVPVIISDALLLPTCVDWTQCSVRVAERDLPRIPEILAAREPEWERLARGARAEWERCFGDSTLLATLLAQVAEIVAARGNAEKRRGYLFPFRVLPDYAVSRAKAAVRRLQSRE